MNDDLALMKAFSFTEDDLAANRQGLISPSQQEKIKEKREFETHLILPFRIIIVGGSAFMCSFYTLLIIHKTGTYPEFLNALLFAAVVMFTSVFSIIFATVKNLRHYARAKLAVAEGPVQLIPKKRRSAGTSYYLPYVKIGQMEFYVVSKEAQDAFKEGSIYRAYYVPSHPGLIFHDLTMLLAVEPVISS